MPLEEIREHEDREPILYYSPYAPPDRPGDQLMNRERLRWSKFPYRDVVLWFDKDGRLRNCSIWQ
jgi:hypothetical protein